MRRTTIRLDDRLLAEAKALAARTDRTLTQVIEDALREALARRSASAVEDTTLTTVGGNGPRPGVDLDDSAALWDVMDQPDAAR